MTDFTALAERYVAVFDEADPAARADRVAELFAPDVRYVDPLADVTGHEGVAGFVTAAREQLAGCAFRLVGAVDAHHDQARFRWAAAPPEVHAAGGDAPVVGFDVVVVGTDGRIREVRGFLDVMPAG
ncbi:nuclear transport factor 2 family protein [Pseudonocardia sp. HH130630-07]|uniref:nuclear transport factor 2 family protein n=1 Tax=Pseudonocardia sp. HH130630-07 TaxID=1690815 RepID=UPI000814C4B0|nr:nuclear transport factor 2 family protein [Pseudonocardia sp. HH130630-07]ANY05469.1 polyketide cyclase [Pseudonocardia sp. HH130630-07]